MKSIWLHSVRAYLKLGLFFYFKHVFTHNDKGIPKNKPVLFLVNHQNALLDALLIATNSNRFLYFLTRAGVFKSKCVSKILKSLLMLPVYRVRDGWANLSNNEAIFKTCGKLFNKNEAIVIFPEGSHNIKRTVRPLSKGFTRIIFETLEQYPNTDLQLIPVGLNFINAEKFPDSAAIFFGDAIPAKSFITGNKKEDVVALRTKIQSEISKLTTHIPSDKYEETLNKLYSLKVDFLNPKSVNKAIASNYSFYEGVTKNHVSGINHLFKAFLKLLLIGPYIIWKLMVRPKIKEIEFISTFRFAMAITLIPIWILFIVLTLAFSVSSFAGLLYLVFVLGAALLAVKI